MYPTKEEILKKINKIDVVTDSFIVKLWKKNFYLNKWFDNKLDKLKILCKLLVPEYIVVYGDSYYCIIESKIISIGPNPSIVSTLHEIGHAKYGTSELDACAYSIKIFSEIFPKEYSKLRWHGHMLIK